MYFEKTVKDVFNIVPLLALLVGVTFWLLPSRRFTFSAVLVIVGHFVVQPDSFALYLGRLRVDSVET